MGLGNVTSAPSILPHRRTKKRTLPAQHPVVVPKIERETCPRIGFEFSAHCSDLVGYALFAEFGKSTSPHGNTHGGPVTPIDLRRQRLFLNAAVP